MEVQKFDRAKSIGDLISVEFDQNYCRENGVLLAGSGAAREIPLFAVLGQQLLGAASSAAKSGGNTGNGTFVLDATTPIRVGAKSGVYTLRCITAVTNGGVFRLEDPDGFNLGDFTIAAGPGGVVTVDDDIKGVLTDAGTDFIVGDGFDITIALGNLKYVQIDFAGVGGAQSAAGIALAAATAADGVDGEVTLLRRGPAIVRSDELAWPDGATDAQKLLATQQLEARGILARASG